MSKGLLPQFICVSLPGIEVFWSPAQGCDSLPSNEPLSKATSRSSLIRCRFWSSVFEVPQPGSVRNKQEGNPPQPKRGTYQTHADALVPKQPPQSDLACTPAHGGSTRSPSYHIKATDMIHGRIEGFLSAPGGRAQSSICSPSADATAENLQTSPVACPRALSGTK